VFIGGELSFYRFLNAGAAEVERCQAAPAAPFSFAASPFLHNFV